MTTAPKGWDTYDPNDHECSTDPEYLKARVEAAKRRVEGDPTTANRVALLDAKERLFMATPGQDTV